MTGLSGSEQAGLWIAIGGLYLTYTGLLLNLRNQNRQQATKVSAWIAIAESPTGDLRHKLYIRNSSDATIHDAKAQLLNGKELTCSFLREGDEVEFDLDASDIGPSSQILCHWPLTVVVLTRQTNIRLYFRDANGRSFRRNDGLGGLQYRWLYDRVRICLPWSTLE